MKWIWAGIAGLFFIAGIAIWWYVSNPVWFAAFSTAAAGAMIKALWPHIWVMLRPKPFSEEQLERIRRGEDPFNYRPPGAGHD